MSGNARFWRNLALIGVAHAVLITGLVRWSRDTKKSDAPNVVWLGGAAGDAAGITKPKPTPKPVKISTPQPELKSEEEEPDETVLTAAKSEIQLPAAIPKPSLTPTPTPSPKPSPKVKVPPKTTPKPRPSPKPTPKPSPKKMVLAKASPKPTPKPKPTPNEKPSDEDVDVQKEKLAKEEQEKTGAVEATDKAAKIASGQPSQGKSTSSGNGGHGGGGTIQSQFGWYGSMLHDRFYSEWAQPTAVAANAKMSALVKIRIQKDGHVSSFEIVRPSGNEAVDQSITAAAKRVTQVDPLPAGLGNGDHYDVKINFELNSD